MAKVAEELPEDYYLAIGEDYEIYVLDEYGQPLSNKEEQ